MMEWVGAGGVMREGSWLLHVVMSRWGGDPWCLAPLPRIICTGMLAAARKAHRPQKSINWFEFVTLVERET